MEVVASLSQGRTAAAQCGLFTYKSVPVIFEPPCIISAASEFQLLISATLPSNFDLMGQCCHQDPMIYLTV